MSGSPAGSVGRNPPAGLPSCACRAESIGSAFLVSWARAPHASVSAFWRQTVRAPSQPGPKRLDLTSIGIGIDTAITATTTPPHVTAVPSPFPARVTCGPDGRGLTRCLWGGGRRERRRVALREAGRRKGAPAVGGAGERNGCAQVRSEWAT